MQTFSNLRILNLWGDSNKRNARPGDQNVFDITEGVSIFLGTRDSSQDGSRVAYSEIQGTREEKYRGLEEAVFDVPWQKIEPSDPHYLFSNIDGAIGREYSGLGPPLDGVFEVSGAGMKSNRDRFATDESPSDLLSRMQEFARNDISDEAFREQYNLKDNYTWKMPAQRVEFRSRPVSAEKIVPLAYRPFDNRHVYYDKAIVFNPRVQVMRHLIHGPNLAIVSIGQNESRDFNHAFVTRSPAEIKLATHYGASVVFPLRLYPMDENANFYLEDNTTRSNLTEAADRLLKIANTGGDLVGEPDVIVCNYIYAILYSPMYRSRYADQFLTDFPRIPEFPSNELFCALAQLGRKLTDLHLMESPDLDDHITVFRGPDNPIVGRVGWSGGTVWLDAVKTNAREGHRSVKPGTIGFTAVPEEVWDFRIGGYQVCHKWLKDRKGRTLSNVDIAHYQKIVVALNETVRLMKEIDEVIEQYGGWPQAFSRQDDTPDSA